MATKSKRCLGVDIGSHSLKVAELGLTSEGIVVHKMVGAELDLAPGSSEAERATAIVKTLRKLLKTHKIATRQAVFCVPGQQTFLRRLPALPQTTEERLMRVLEYEADNLVPFPPDQSLRRFQVEKTADTDEYEVLLAAMKRDQIDQFMRLISRTGLKPLQISVSPLALHNFYRFCERPFISPEEKRRLAKEAARRVAQEQKDAALKEKNKGKKPKKGKKSASVAVAEAEESAEKKKKGFSLGSLFSKKSKKKEAEEEAIEDELEDASGEIEAPESEGDDELTPEMEALAREAMEEEFHEVVAYVHIGARTLDLSIPKFDEGLKYGFTRSVPLAGDEMTLAVQRAKQFTSFSEAEEFKKAHTAVIDPEMGSDMAPEGADWDASEALTKIVDRMLIELRRSLDFFISQPDGVAVDVIAISGGQSGLEGLRERMEERLGIEVRITEESPNPERLIIAAENAPPLTNYVIAAGLGVEGLDYGELKIDFLPDEFQVLRQLKKKKGAIGAMAAGLAIMIYLSTMIGERGVIMYNSAAQEAQDQIDRFQREGWQTKYAAATGERQKLQKNYETLQHAFAEVSNDFWFDFMNYLNQKKPSDIVLTNLTLGGVGEVEIKGTTSKEYSPSQFATDLQEDKDLILKVTSKGTTQISASNYEFTISVIVDKSARLITPAQKIVTQPGAAGGAMGAPMGGP